MAISSKTTMLVLVIFAVISIVSFNVKAQSPVAAPAPGTAANDCMTLLYNMSDCLTYVEEGSKLSQPDKSCCPELAGMLDANPICLCQLLGKSKDFGLELDIKRAMKLPSSCGLQTPDISLCSVAGIPVGSPMGGLAGAPSSSGGPSSSAAGMSPEAGETAAGKNGASSVHFNVAYVVAGLAMALTLSKL